MGTARLRGADTMNLNDPEGFSWEMGEMALWGRWPRDNEINGILAGFGNAVP